MAKGITESADAIKEESKEIYKDIEEACEVIKSALAKLNPYLWYFKIIQTNYEKAHPEIVLNDFYQMYRYNITDLLDGYPGFKWILALMPIMTIDLACQNISKEYIKLEKTASDYFEKIMNDDLKHGELKKKSKDMEKSYYDLEELEEYLVRKSESYVKLMVLLQSNFPDEYVLYTKVENENNNLE